MNTRPKKRIRHSFSSDDDSDYLPDDDDISNLRNTNKKAYNNFTDAKIEIIKSEPTIMKILNESLLIKDRSHLLQLYEIYKSVEPNTENWLEIRNRINKVFEQSKDNYLQHQRYTPEQHNDMNNRLKLLNNHDIDSDIELEYKILQLETSIENQQIIYRKYNELRNMTVHDDERYKLVNWLKWSISIPHDKIKTFPFSKDKLTNFLRQVSDIMDKELYGMKKVKEQILLFVSSKIQNPHMKKCSLGLIGQPGIGKTMISRLLARVLNFPFEQISLGGISNPDYLKGHEPVYIGSHPGEIVQCMKRMKYKNGILFLDEFDKISNNRDMCSALLHITDPSQNSEFRDKFLSGISIDLSHLWFIYSMNNLPQDSALCDRIDLIKVPGYSLKDKICIVIDYLFPKALKNISTSPSSIQISRDVAKYLIVNKTDWEIDLGVRAIEKLVNKIVTKVDFLIKHQDKKGKLKGFNMSFELGKSIKYPIKLSQKMIDIFC